MIKFYFYTAVFVIALSITIHGCSSQPEYPSINYSSEKSYDYGQIVWRDLISPDPEISAKFYQNVFGWSTKKTGTEEEPYWLFSLNGKPVAGMYKMRESSKNAGGEWLSYFSVNSPGDIINKSKSNGGNLVLKQTDIPGRGKVALISDPQGAYFAMIKSYNGDPLINRTTEFNFLWSELWSNDMAKSEDFYKTIFNSQIKNQKDDERDYIVMINNNKPAFGIIKNPVENIRSHFIQYILVNDVKGIEKKAKDAGAKIIIPSDSTIRNGTVSVFADPAGAPIAIQKWPVE